MSAAARRRAAAALGVAAALTAAGCGASHPAGSSAAPKHEAARVIGTPSARDSHARYGGVPSWLPKAPLPVSRTLSASPGHPNYAIEGNSVEVHLPSGSAEVTAVGPDVPEEGKQPVPETSPCRFVISIAAVRGSIPLRAADFTTRDDRGHVHRLGHVRLLSGGRLPARLGPSSAPVTIVASAVLPTGDGALRWTPTGSAPLVEWDFEVEID